MRTTRVTREALIESALRILEKANSSEALTVDALASDLHMSKTTLYKHFDGLDDLTYGVVEHLATQTETDLANIDTSGTASEIVREVASVYGRYAERMPYGLMGTRGKLPTAARLRLENVEERLGDRMFRAIMAADQTAYVAQAVRSAYDGLVHSRYLLALAPDERPAALLDWTVALRACLP